MNERNRREVHKLASLGTRLGILISIGVFTLEEALAIIMEIINNKAKLPKKMESAVVRAIPILLEKIATVLDERDVRTLSYQIVRSGKNPVTFVQEMDIDTIDPEEFINLSEDSEVAFSEQEIREIKTRPVFVDLSRKELGQEVMIGHELFTNMLVTSEGVQMPSKSFTIPAVPELMGMKAKIVEIESNSTKYLCASCNKKHTADIRIAFEEYNMEFYINSAFIKPYKDEKTTSGT